MLVFIHIPKTAGTSINRLLKNNIPNYIGYGRVHTLTLKEKKLITNNRNKEKTVICGHISCKELSILNIPLYNMFTILRNPIHRCISWYGHTGNGKKIFGKQVSLHYFFSIIHKDIYQNCYNRMTYQLGDYADCKRRNKDEMTVLNTAKKNILQFKFIIIFENLKNDIKNHLYSDTILHKRNSNNKYNKIDNKTISLIKKWNKLDIELYNFALQHLGKEYLKFKI